MLQIVVVLFLFVSGLADTMDGRLDINMLQALFRGNPIIVEYLLDTGAFHKLKSNSEYIAYNFAVLDVLKL